MNCIDISFEQCNVITNFITTYCKTLSCCNFQSLFCLPLMKRLFLEVNFIYLFQFFLARCVYFSSRHVMWLAFANFILIMLDQLQIPNRCFIFNSFFVNKLMGTPWNGILFSESYAESKLKGQSKSSNDRGQCYFGLREDDAIHCSRIAVYIKRICIMYYNIFIPGPLK